MCYQKRFPTSLRYTPDAPPGRRASMGGYSRFHHSVLERRALRVVGTAALFTLRSDLRHRREGRTTSRRVFLAKLVLGWDLLHQADAPNTQTVHSGEYPRRTWRDWEEDHFEATFRFRKQDMPRLMAALELPQEFVTSEGVRFTADEAITVLLLKLTTPTTLHAIHVATGRRPGHTSPLLKQLFKWIDDTWSLRLLGSDLKHWTPYFPEWAAAIFDKTGRRGLDGCIGFIDGTLRGIARPIRNEDVMFNGTLISCPWILTAAC